MSAVTPEAASQYADDIGKRLGATSARMRDLTAHILAGVRSDEPLPQSCTCGCSEAQR